MCDCYYYYDCYYHTVYSAILSILAERDGSSSKIKMRLFFAVSVRPKEARARPIAEKTRQWFTIGPIDRPIDRWLQINILVYRLRWPVLLYYFILHAEYACGLTTCPFITATYYRCVLLLLVVIVVVVHCCWWFVYYILHHYFDVFFFHLPFFFTFSIQLLLYCHLIVLGRRKSVFEAFTLNTYIVSIAVSVRSLCQSWRNTTIWTMTQKIQSKNMANEKTKRKKNQQLKMNSKNYIKIIIIKLNGYKKWNTLSYPWLLNHKNCWYVSSALKTWTQQQQQIIFFTISHMSSNAQTLDANHDVAGIVPFGWLCSDVACRSIDECTFRCFVCTFDSVAIWVHAEVFNFLATFDNGLAVPTKCQIISNRTEQNKHIRLDFFNG